MGVVQVQTVVSNSATVTDRSQAKMLVREISRVEAYLEALYASLLEDAPLPKPLFEFGQMERPEIHLHDEDEVSEDEEDSAGGQTGQAVEVLARDPERVWTPKTLSKEIDLPSTRCGTLLSRAFRLGLIQRVSRGQYRARKGRR